MRIKKIELFHLRMPLNFIFKTSQTSLGHRETIIIKLHDELGNKGFGEVVAFNEPFYTKETLLDSKNVLIQEHIPILMNNEIEHPFDIHKLVDKEYPMAAAGLENALLDLYAVRLNKPVINLVFDEEINSEIYAGVVLGDLEIPKLLDQMQAYQKEGYLRFKVKIKPEDGFEKLKAVRNNYPDIKLLADANQSFRIDQIEELKKLDAFNLLCIEEPLASADFLEYQKLQKVMKTPICLDESIQSLDELNSAIGLEAMKVLNIKIGRVGGLYYVKQMIELCRKNNIEYWIGSMVESGISKILHVYLAGLKDTYIPGDLSSSSRYFKKDIITPEITAENGRIRLPKGSGLGVEVDEDALNRFTIDYIKVDGEENEFN